MASTAKLLNDDAGYGIATSDVRRIMLGEKELSNVVGAKALGFKPEDVDSATEESNIVSSRPLGAGAGGKTYLLTTKSGGELVFKPDNNIECVNDYTERNCPSIFKREYLHQMFDQPKTTA